jgi:hypothetical protein
MGKEFITDNGYIMQTPASLSEGLEAGDDDAPLKVDSHGTNTASKAVGKKFGVAKKVTYVTYDQGYRRTRVVPVVFLTSPRGYRMLRVLK